MAGVDLYYANIEKLSSQIYDDVQKLRESDMKVSERAGLEIMALNALTNAYNALNNNG